MADWSKPALASTYANFVTETNARDTDLAVMFDPAVTTPTNFAVSTVRWRSAANKWEKWDGTVWSDLAATYAISISGNAATASALSLAPGSVLEVGRYFDFHSAANGYDYDVRLDAQAGASAGDGTLVITASSVVAKFFTGTLVGNATTATNASGSSFSTKATAEVGQLVAQKSGQNPACLYNNDSAWGLYSPSGGVMAAFDRATGKFRFYGNAETATSAANGGVTSVNGQTGAVTTAHTHSDYVSANMTHGAVGSLCFAYMFAGVTPIEAGDTCIGSCMKPCSVSSTVVGYGTLTGTWRCLGRVDAYGYATLWQRII